MCVESNLKAGFIVFGVGKCFQPSGVSYLFCRDCLGEGSLLIKTVVCG